MDEIDLFLQGENGRQVVDFLTGLASLASAKIKVCMLAHANLCSLWSITCFSLLLYIMSACVSAPIDKQICVLRWA